MRTTLAAAALAACLLGCPEPTRCDGEAAGATQSRIRYAAASVAPGATCLFEAQTRSCEATGWSAWTGTYAEPSCAVRVGASCGATPHGGTEERACYGAASVPAGTVCSYTTQSRTCDDGAWSPDFPACAHVACSVEGAQSCGATPHGQDETRRCYDAAVVPAGGTCTFTTQTRTCADGAWTPDFPTCANLSCTVTGFANCGAAPHGSVESRTCYDAAMVPAGSTCTSTTQTRTCSDGAWSAWPSCPALSCTVGAYANCGATPHGGTETRPCFTSASVPFGSTCQSTTQSRSCSDGTWSAWPACAHLSCAVDPPVCSLQYPMGSCPTGQFCSANGSCIATGTCAIDSDCTGGQVCHGAACVPPSADYAGDGPELLGLNATCDIFKAGPPGDYGGDPAFATCERALILAKNLGVSWIRWGLPWMWFHDGATAIPQRRLDFMARVLAAARARGLKVLFQIALPAPSNAYTPAEPASQMLHFDDAKYAAFVDAMLETARPYTPHFEIFNEVNYGGEGIFVPVVTSPTDQPRARLMSRFRHLLALTRQRMDAARTRHPDFRPRLVSAGLSFDEVMNLTDTFDGQGNLTSLSPYSVVADLGAPPQLADGGTVLRQVIDAVGVHPYFTTPTRAAHLASFKQAVTTAAGVARPVWVTETGFAACNPVQPEDRDAGVEACIGGWPSTGQGVEFLDDLAAAATAGSIQRVFWFTTYAYAGTKVRDSNAFSLYSEDGWSARQPAVAGAMFDQSRRVPYDTRFSAPAPSSPVVLDLAAQAPGVAWVSGTGASSTALTWSSARVGAFTGNAENGQAVAGVRATLDDSVDWVEGRFTQVSVPATGTPTLRLQLGFGASAPSGAPVRFEVWLIGGAWPSNQVLFPYLKSRTGALETAEVDLSQVRGTTISVNLRVVRTGTLGAGVQAPVVWASPRIIDRR